MPTGNKSHNSTPRERFLWCKEFTYFFYLTHIIEEILMTTTTRLHFVSKLFLQWHSFLKLVMVTISGTLSIIIKGAIITIVIIIIIIIIINLNDCRTFQPQATPGFIPRLFNHDDSVEEFLVENV